MSISIFVRVGSVSKDYNRFKFACFPDVSEDCINEYYDEEGNLYFSEIDSYYYLEQARAIIDGRVSDYSRGRISFLAIILAVIYSLMHLLGDISLVSVAAIIGPIVFSLSCIPSYVFIKKKTNRIGGFTAGLFAGICAPFVVYASFARFDTDILLFLLPLTTMLCYILALETKEQKRRIRYVVIGLVSFFVLALTWASHAVYFYLVVLISMVLFAISFIKVRFRIRKIMNENWVKTSIIYLLLMLIICIIVDSRALISKIMLVVGWVFGEGYNVDGVSEFYPDGQMFVGELQPVPVLNGGWLGLTDASKIGIINWFGGITMALFIVVIFIFFIYKIAKYVVFKEEKNSWIVLQVVLVVWSSVTCLAAVRGVRFMKEPMIPIALMAGLGMGMFYELLKKKEHYLVVFVTCWLLICAPSFSVYFSFEYNVPMISDSFQKASEFIRKNYANEYIIVVPWSFGYYYASESAHDVVSDGGSLAYDRYWVADALMSNNERYSAGIFEMIVNMGQDKFKELAEMVGGEGESVRVIKRIAPLEKKMVPNVLQEEFHFSEENIVKIMSMIFGEKKAIVVVNQTDFSSVGSMQYYHCWDFRRRTSECAVSKGDEMAVLENIDAAINRNDERDEAMQELRFEGGYDQRTMMARIFDKDQNLKRIHIEKDFYDKFGIGKVVIAIVD